MHRFKAAAAAPILLLLLGSADAPIEAGLWEIRNTPGVATLDGQVLNELPIGPIEAERICVSAEQAVKPSAFFSRDMDPACVLKKASTAGGRVDIGGTCPNQLEGPEGSFELKGSYDSNSYDIHFATVAFGDNGRMGFTGRLTGKRVGACPPS
ncbi:MAG TPA: DUF3617 family protein [Allosphingosinicella sp.]|nr:DUF3617 family protein [Allosphingosinicella sp.]